MVRRGEYGRAAIAPSSIPCWSGTGDLVWSRGLDRMRALALAGMRIARAACFAFVALAATRRLTLVAIGLIVGGALGTLMDRFRFGAVADFLSLARFWVLLERSISPMRPFGLASPRLSSTAILLQGAPICRRRCACPPQRLHGSRFGAQKGGEGSTSLVAPERGRHLHR